MKTEKPIRVLHVLTAMNRAGTETMLMNLYRCIDKTRIQFDFAVSVNDECDYDSEIRQNGGKIIHYPKYNGKNHFQYKKWWETFFKQHNEYRIIHGHIGSTASIYLRIAKKYGCYTIAHSHSTSAGFGLHKIMYKLYSHSTRKIADFFIGCSTEALVARYGKKVAENSDISIVLKNGIDTKKYLASSIIRKEVLSQFNLSDETLILGTVGRLTPEKNPMFILEILQELKSRIPSFKFLWAGTGELEQSIRREIQAKDLNNNVLLLGVRNDIPRILQVLNVFILPSVFEGLPVVGVEAQAAGVPILCSDKVSAELKITDCIKFIPIDSAELWVKEIMNEKEYRRIEGTSKDVMMAGYDINDTSRWLTDFYLKHWRQ